MAVRISQKVFSRGDIKEVLHVSPWEFGGPLEISSFDALELDDDYVTFINKGTKSLFCRNEIKITFKDSIAAKSMSMREVHA